MSLLRGVPLSPRRFACAGLALALVIAAGGLISAAAAAPLDQGAAPSCTPANAIRIVLENPKPFDVLNSGSQITMTGMAYDPAATNGSTGIDAVTLFMGARESGGIFLGQATLGQPNPESAPVQNAGFTVRTNSLPSGSGQRTIWVYAHSSASSREASIQVPVFLGPAPTAQAGSTATPTVTPTPAACTPVPTPTNTPAPAAPAAAAPAPAAPGAAQPAPVAPAAAPTPIPIPTLPSAALPPVSAAQPTVRPTSTPVVPRPAVTPALAPAPVTAPATATTAPRGGGIPPELGLPLLVGGASTLLGGFWLRRRERRDTSAGEREVEPDA